MNAIVAVVILGVVVICVLYLLMIMPRMTGKPDVEPFQKVLYAHRGLHDNDSDTPENSMAAFRKAVEGGYGIELDIQLSKDKVPVVFHDFALVRMCGIEGKVNEFQYEDLHQLHLNHSRECIPALEEVLRLVDGKVPLIIELKMDNLDISLCSVADKLLRGYHGTYCVESFNPLAVYWYRCNRKDVMRGQLADAFIKKKEYKSALYMILQGLLLNWLGKPDFVAYNHEYPRMLSRCICHKLYRGTAVGWTIKSEEELEKAKQHFDMFIFDSFVPKQGSRA